MCCSYLIIFSLPYFTLLAHILFTFLLVFEVISTNWQTAENSSTMDFRPRETPFFADSFFRFGPLAFKFSRTSFQLKRRFLSIWSVNKKKSKIRVGENGAPFCHGAHSVSRGFSITIQFRYYFAILNMFVFVCNGRVLSKQQHICDRIR